MAIAKNKLLLSTITMLIVWGLTIGTNKVNGVEQRKPEEIPIDELFKEVYRTKLNSDSLSLVLWMPWEHWKAAFTQNKEISLAQIDFLETEFSSVFILAVVQANVSTTANITFLPEQTIKQGLKVTYVNSDGRTLNLNPSEKISPSMNMFKNIIRPILSKAMGNYGENFWLFFYSDVDTSGKRIVSPYEPGKFQIALNNSRTNLQEKFVIELPLNSLFVPRVCADNKPVHISWKYCPWDGTKLSN